MNHIHRSIWNDQTGTFVAVSENTRSAGKTISSCHSTAGDHSSFRLKTLAVSLMLACSVGVQAQPTGGVVAAGSASIGGAPGNMVITQTTANAVINWQSFGIKAGESVQFVQPSSSSVMLNRVVGADPSQIFGNLSANGRVFLVNPNGILFGQGASVNVGALVASTLAIGNSDFMNGNYKFAGAGIGTVVNQGTLNAADGGYVALMGASVSNQGVISAQLGTVALAAGNAVTLDLAGDKLLKITVDQGAVNALVENGGLIRADGGQVLMTTQAAGSLLASAVNNTGMVQAQTLANVNGTIKLLGGMASGTVNLGGTLDVSGKGAGQNGGSVTATGHHVGLFGAHIDASGAAGGGTVLVGGDYQGTNPSVQNASATYMSADSSINADAITNGNGGKAILWSNDSTRAYGAITARGGALGGDGGLIETSGHWLDVTGIAINASATNGKSGLWLLDPADVTISAAVTSNATPDTPIPGVFSPDPSQGSANINAAQLMGLLNGGTNVTITTTNTGAPGIPSNVAPASGLGDINVNAALTYGTGTVNSTLTLNAAGDVNINAAISPTQGNLVVCCGRDINVKAAITMVRGSMLLSAGRNINQTAAITSTDGNIAMCSGGDINVLAAITSTRGTVDAANNRSLANLGVRQGLSFIAGNAATGPGLVGGGGAVNISPPGGTVTVNQSAVVGEEVPVTVFYNPVSYSAPVVDYTPRFSTFNPLTVRRLVFPSGADKTFDGTTAATCTSLKTDAGGISPAAPGALTLAGAGTFATAAVGVGKIVTFSGLTLGGASAALFALPADCCGSTKGTGRTTANIAAVVFPPVVPVVPPLAVVPPTPIDVIPTIPAFADEMQPLELSETQADEPVPAPVIVPIKVQPKAYVAPVRPPKQDRN